MPVAKTCFPWKAILGILCAALPAVRVGCSSSAQQENHTPVGMSLAGLPMAYPVAAEESTALVRELLNPISLESFAENYWEKRPLIVRGRPQNYYDRLVGFGASSVESVIENGVSLVGEGEGPMTLGSDWNIIKRVFMHADGEFWTAGLPPSKGERQNGARQEGDGEAGAGGRTVSLESARAAFQRGGFSIVINRLQRRWRSVSRLSLALEDVLGQPVNANLYMTPPGSQGFEAHFDWMDGIVVQLVGSKTWILYDEMVAFPRPDLRYKPASADLGEPIAELELHPGDMMYIPRGWPHEAAVNGTGAGAGRVGQKRKEGEPLPSATAGRGLSLHVTFGIETALSGTYESLLHHGLEVAAAEHPLMFGLPPPQGWNSSSSSSSSDENGENWSANNAEDDEEGVEKGPGVPWLQLLHLWVHEAASRNSHLRRAVPLAPLFFGSLASRTPPATTRSGNSNDGGNNDLGKREGSCSAAETAEPLAALLEFQAALEACVSAVGGVAEAEGGASTVTLRLLDSLLEEGNLERVQGMFLINDVGGDGSGGGGNRDDEDCGEGGCAAARTAPGPGDKTEGAFRRPRTPGEDDWSRAAFESFDRSLFSSSALREKLDEFGEVVSPSGALARMVKAATRRARDRAAVTERDLARCGQARA